MPTLPQKGKSGLPRLSRLADAQCGSLIALSNSNDRHRGELSARKPGSQVWLERCPNELNRGDSRGRLKAASGITPIQCVRMLL